MQVNGLWPGADRALGVRLGNEDEDIGQDRDGKGTAAHTMYAVRSTQYTSLAMRWTKGTRKVPACMVLWLWDQEEGSVYAAAHVYCGMCACVCVCVRLLLLLRHGTGHELSYRVHWAYTRQVGQTTNGQGPAEERCEVPE